MGSIGNRFTNEIYATKKEVQNILNITMVDRYWAEIVTFRSNFTVNLGIKSIDNSNFSVCLASTINEKLNSVERKLNKAYKKFVSIDSEGIRKIISRNSLINILMSVAKSLMIEVSEEEVKQIVNGNISAISPDKIILQKYNSFLIELYSKESVSSLDAITDYLYDSISMIIPSFDESGVMYRTKPLSTNKAQYFDNVYDESPVKLIEPLMNELFRFLITSNKSFLIKTIVTIFYINYIKPFEAYNELVSCLLSKYIILNSDLESICSLINLEEILLKDTKLQEVVNESKKTCDITYFLNYFCDKLSTNLDLILDNILQMKSDDIKNEYFDIESSENKDNQIVNMSESELKENISEVNSINIEKPSEEKINDSLLEDSNGINPLIFTRNAAITNLTFGYSEEEAKKVEQFLIESNPNLSHSQAFFYARHCTIGKYYTISQYKKETGCAYETARTSMDKLVSEGYYAKEGYKNKYLYTPIKRK